MEKETATSTTKPLGMCEKLFNAFHSNTTFRPLRRLTFGNQDPATTTTTDNNNSSNINNHIEKNQVHQTLPTPTKPSPALPDAKAKVDIKVEGKSPEKPQVIPPPITIPTITVTTARKVPEAEKVLPIPAPPKTVAVTPLQPAEAGKPKKNINQKAEDYIARAKVKISWSSSGVGKTPQSK